MVSPSPGSPGPEIAGRYTILRKLGSGSMGAVYLARDTGLERLVAVKLLHAERLGPDVTARMQEEFRAIASLEHPRIAAAYDFGYTRHGSIPFYTREYVAGQPLPPGPPSTQLTPAKFLQPIVDLLEALRYVHARGVLHLDVHAGNLIVADEATRGAILIDFGLVQPIDGPRLSSGSGKLDAVPPEIIERDEVTPRTDVYLAGRLLQYRLTGTSGGEPRLPREIPGWGVRRTLEIERITARAVQISPENRFQTAAQFSDALAAALGSGPSGRVESSADGATPDLSVGRDQERRRIESCLSDAARGAPTAVWLIGESGTGKTRLLSDARLNAQLRGLETIFVECDPDRESGFGLLRALRRQAGALDWLKPLAPRHGGTPSERARRAADACLSQAGEPLVLLFDDLEKADRESLLFVESLLVECLRRRDNASAGRGVALIVASESPPPRAAPRSCVQRLGRLSASESRWLIRHLLPSLEVPARLLRLAVSTGRGLPLRLGRVASALREEASRRGGLDHLTELPRTASEPPLASLNWTELPGTERRILEMLMVVGRAATREEISWALEVPPGDVSRALRQLTRIEALLAHGRPSRFQLAFPLEADHAPHPRSVRARTIHSRLVELHERRRAKDLRDLEDLARHLAALRRHAAARDAVLAAVSALRRRGSFERAVSLLEEFVRLQRSSRPKVRLVEELSSILEETGDHQRAIAALEPLCRAERTGLTDREDVRLQRRLGIHYHRAGHPARALEIFAKTLERADPRRDLEDLVFIDAELAEIQIFQGAFDEAEAACRRGLERIAKARVDAAFRGRMEVTLRASLGHIELRRMQPRRARDELRAGLELACRFGTTSEQATITHNLAIAANQLGAFAEARRCFTRAQRLMSKAGDERSALNTAANLAVLAAKLGDAGEARRQLENAARLVRRYPGQRLEFFTLYSRGVVSLLLGEAESAVDAFESALARGRDVGDDYLVLFGEVYLAEAHLVCGRYAKARRQLRLTARRAPSGPPMLGRMVDSRLFLVESLLGDRRAAARARASLERAERTDVDLVEAWNDLWTGLALLVSGEHATPMFEDAARVFRRLKIPYGLRFARLGRLVQSLGSGRSVAIRRHLDELERQAAPPHALLTAAEALARGAAYLALGQIETASSRLGEASASIVGLSSVELDWMLELLRARLSLREGDAANARRHVHRSLHSRDYLLQLVPEKARERFSAQPRFRSLEETATRLRRTPALALGTRRVEQHAAYEGLVGRSSGISRVIQTIERTRDHELAVLLTGETGTGKDVVARAIYGRSPRRRGAYQVLHCAALPEELFESELFGYRAGAFTGAEEDRAGLLENLRGGTLLFDEVSELSPSSQAKLLSILDGRVVRRLGDESVTPIDVRFLFSTSRNLEELTRTGAFRVDFYHRIRGLEIELPPLRERKTDIPLLARHFLTRHASQLERPVVELDESALDLLGGHDWPGNVRELETVLFRALVHLSGPGPLLQRDIRGLVTAPGQERTRRDLLGRSLEDWRRELERDYLTQLFFDVDGNVAAMTRRLGITRTTLYDWFKGAGVDLPELRARLGS